MRKFAARVLFAYVSGAVWLVSSPATAQPPAPVYPKSGFNDASGIHADATANSPFAPGASLHNQGASELGWLEAWRITTGSVLVQAVSGSFEGDGAAFFQGTDEIARRVSTPYTTPFRVDYRVMIPGPISRDIVLRIYDHNRLPDIVQAIAAQLSVQSDFQIVAVDGFCDFADDDCVNLEPTGMFLTQGQFHTISIEVDPASKTWGLLLDGVRYNAPDPLDFRGTPTQLDTIGYLNEIDGPNGSYRDSVIVGPLTPPDVFLKRITSGPDRNGDQQIDRVLSIPATQQSEFVFQIAFTQAQLPPAAIQDIVSAEWEIVSCVPDGPTDLVLMSPTGPKRKNGFFDTQIQWFPDGNDGVLTCTIRTRKLKKGFEPKIAGRLYLNRGARAVDPATQAPLLDDEGQPLVTNSLLVGAVADANKDKRVDPSGNGDEDGDTLTDFHEVEIGTNPAKKDTDGDKVPDNLDPAPLNKSVK